LTATDREGNAMSQADKRILEEPTEVPSKRIKLDPRALVLLSKARKSLQAAHSLLPSVAKTRQDATYRKHVLLAATCLRKLLALSDEEVRPEWRLTAQIWLVDLILTEANLKDSAARKEVERLLRQGLHSAQKHPSLKRYHRALQSAQVRFLASEGPSSSGEKMAKSEIKRLCGEISSLQ
jgi:hypothetical protein